MKNIENALRTMTFVERSVANHNLATDAILSVRCVHFISRLMPRSMKYEPFAASGSEMEPSREIQLYFERANSIYKIHLRDTFIFLLTHTLIGSRLCHVLSIALSSHTRPVKCRTMAF